MSSAQRAGNRSKGVKARSRSPDTKGTGSEATLELKRLLARIHRRDLNGQLTLDEKATPTSILRLEISGWVYHVGRVPCLKKPLSPKERAIVARLLEGLEDKQIAEELKMARGTLATHLRRIRQKLGVRTRAGIVRMGPYLS